MIYVLVVLAALIGCEDRTEQQSLQEIIYTPNGENKAFGNEGGNGENVDEDGIIPGDENHFDVDVFMFGTSVYHAHAYDQQPQYTECDFTQDKLFDFLAAISTCDGDLKYIVQNARRGSGDLKLKTNQKYKHLYGYPTFADAMGGLDEFEFDAHPKKFDILTFLLSVNYQSGVFERTRPSAVLNDPGSRASSFRVRVLCDKEEIWEVVVYQHVVPAQLKVFYSPKHPS